MKEKSNKGRSVHRISRKSKLLRPSRKFFKTRESRAKNHVFGYIGLWNISYVISKTQYSLKSYKKNILKMKKNDYTCEINENATAAIESLSNFHKYNIRKLYWKWKKQLYLYDFKE